jgi:UDP-glucuronate 4-epimerase
MAHTYTHLYGFETVGLRFFTVYGPMGRPDMAIWLFSDAIMNDRPIKVFNHGEMRRDFTYIDDIVSGTVASLFEELPDPCMVFNLGNHRSEALGTFIETIESSLGKKAEKEMLPMQPGDVHETYADVKKAQTVLSYKPSTTLAEGVPRFTAWYLDEWLPYKESLK